MKLLASTKSKKIKNENGENIAHSENSEVVLAHSNIVSNNYQHHSRLLYLFSTNKSFGQLLDISQKNLIF